MQTSVVERLHQGVPVVEGDFGLQRVRMSPQKLVKQSIISAGPRNVGESLKNLVMADVWIQSLETELCPIRGCREYEDESLAVPESKLLTASDFPFLGDEEETVWP